MFLYTYLGRLSRSVYTSNDLLHLLYKVEKVYTDDRLKSIQKILKENLILERPCSRDFDKTKVEIVRGCIYNLDQWFKENKIKLS